MLVALLFCAVDPLRAQPAPTPVTAPVTLAWDANTETDIAGYRIYYYPFGSTAAHVVVNTGNVTNFTISGLTRGTRYVFYATAYNTSGLESEPSNTVEYTPPKRPAAPRTLRISGGT